MIKIAIVEDSASDSEKLKDFVVSWNKEHNQAADIIVFNNAIAFLNNYKAVYDLIFMDIMMPYLDGMSAAKKLREIDSQTALVFVTSLAQYAVEGYEVNAFDFIVKPFVYAEFSLKFSRMQQKLERRNHEFICLQTISGTFKIESSQIYFVEVTKHTLVFHTSLGDFSQYSSLKKIESLLNPKLFAKCSNCYLVNVGCAIKYDKDNVTLNCGGKEICLGISRSKRKEFLLALEPFFQQEK
ncbi:MAG: LytTR family DNA-binding domain-containing protein [Bacilli bacterium]